MPKPKPDENHDDFISRCMSDPDEIGARPDPDARFARCEGIWESEKAMTKTDIIKAISSRTGRYGVLTADRYFRSIEQCFDGGFCPVKLFNAASQDEWSKSLKESEGKLTYSNGEMLVKLDSVSRDLEKIVTRFDSISGSVEDKSLFKEITVKPLVVFDAIVTTTTRDRDRDVMETKGAELDPASPLLWQHIPLQPIGALVGELKDQRTDDMLPARFAIADTELGRDAATLVEMGALRVSHGFDPKDFEPMDDDEGWHFKTFDIFEVSLVSVPSNKDAVITAFSREKLHSPLMRGWAEKMFQERPVQIPATITFPEINIGSITAAQENIKKLREAFDDSKNYGEFAKENAPSIDEIRNLISKSCSCQKDAHGDEEKLQCPKCGFKGAASKFAPGKESEDGKSVDSEKIKLSYDAVEQELMLLANGENPLRLEHTCKRLKAAIQTKEKAEMNEFLVEVGIT